MGFSGMSLGSLLLIGLLVMLLFSSKDTASLSKSIATGLKNFKKGLGYKD
jgi:Sec-independent protein translocase protein TatA